MSLSTDHDTNSKSVHFPITGADLKQFLKTNNGQYVSSKSLSIHNIHFKVYIYPNGIDKKNINYVQFIVLPNKFEPTIKSVTVCCRLFCSIFEIMFKEVRILNKENDSIAWSKYQLPLSEYQKTVFTNDINYLDFVCDIEILKIKYKSNSYTVNNIGRKLSLHRKNSLRKQSSSSVSLENTNVFQPRTLPVKSHVSIEWVITNKIIHLFKNSVNIYKKCIYSQDINNMWCFCILANGVKHKKNANDVELVLKLIRLPDKIKSIEVDLVVQMTQEQKEQSISSERRNVSFSYNKSHELAMSFATAKLNESNSFTLNIIINTIRIFEDTGRGNGKEIRNSWSEFGFDEFNHELFKCDIDYGNEYQNDYYVDDSKHSDSLTGYMADVAENISISQSKSRSKTQKKSTHKESKERARGISYSSLPTPSSRNTAHSITAYSQSSATMLHNISEDKEDKKLDTPSIDHEAWSDQKTEEKDTIAKSEHTFTVQKTSDNMLNEEEEQYDESEEKKEETDNIFCIKFKHWLSDEVQLPEHLPKFEKTKSADIKLIKTFDDENLMGIGIDIVHHRKLILAEAKKFKQGQDEFESLIKTHDELKSFRSNFRKNAILTAAELENMTKPELQKVLSVDVEDGKVDEIWNIIHRIESQPTSPVSQLQMNKFQEQYRLMKTAMVSWQCHMLQMHHEANEEKGDSSIQKQVDDILHDYFSRLVDQRKILDHLFINQNYQKYNLSSRKTIAHDQDRDPSSTQHTSSGSGQTDDYSHIEDSGKLAPEFSNINKKGMGKKRDELVQMSFMQLKKHCKSLNIKIKLGETKASMIKLILLADPPPI